MNDRNAFSEDHLERELRKSLKFELPADFSSQVIQKIEADQQREAARTKWIYLAAVMGFVALSVVALIIFIPAEAKSQMLQIVGWSIPLGLLVVLFQYLDQKFVKKRIVVG